MGITAKIVLKVSEAQAGCLQGASQGFFQVTEAETLLTGVTEAKALLV